MADETPAAPAEAPQAPESEANPTTTNEQATAPEQKVEAPDMYGFTSDQLAEMKKFYDANGGFEKVKSKISNPEPKAAEPEKPAEEPTSQPQAQEPQYKTPAGAITPQEFLAQQYFQSLSKEEKYSAISKGIENGDYLKEMAAFGINAMNQDGSINDQKVRMYLDLKAQTVPAKPTESEPNASAAPTVTYTEIGDGGITNIDQAYKIIMEPGNPNAAKAEEFIKAQLNPNSEKKS